MKKQLTPEEDRLLRQIQEARIVYVCGNGGSASTAEHFTNDLFSRGIMAICLNSNVSIITMIGNDFGYKHIYSKQLEVYGKPGDLLITISCSGDSPNIVEAEKMAMKLEMTFHKFETFDPETDYGILEDKHLQMVHRIKDSL